MKRSRTPNLQSIPLQNIPLRTDVGRAVRAVFAVDHAIVDVDYAQIEARIIGTKR